MQNNVIMAFRKRLSKRGYKYIHIRFDKAYYLIDPIKRYIVSAEEPLTKSIVVTTLTIDDMYHLMR